MPTNLTPEELQSFRRPDVVYTDRFLNDPIRFNPDDAFLPESVIEQETDIVLYPQDNLSFKLVPLNRNFSEYLPVRTYIAKYNPEKVREYINSQFLQYTQVSFGAPVIKPEDYKLSSVRNSDIRKRLSNT
jgi:hypothetical protein